MSNEKMDFDVTSGDGVVSTLETSGVELDDKSDHTPVTERRTKAPESEAEVVVEPPVVADAHENESDPQPELELKPEEDPKPEPAPKKGKSKGVEPWVQRRLDEQAGKQREAERQAEAARQAHLESEARAKDLEAKLAALQRGDAGEVDPKTGKAPDGYVPQSEVERLVAQEAQKRAADEAQRAKQDAFNSKANAAYQAGKSAFDDFDEALQPLQAMGAIQRPDFQEAVLSTDAAPDVIYFLGNNPDKASEILDALKSGNVYKAAADMTKIAMKLNAEKAAKKSPVSKVPAPIHPVGGSAVPILDLERAPIEQFSDEFDKKARAAGWY